MLSNSEWRWGHLKWKLNMLFFSFNRSDHHHKKKARQREGRQTYSPGKSWPLPVYLYPADGTDLRRNVALCVTSFCHLNSIPGRISKHCTSLGQSTKLWRNKKNPEFLRINESFNIFIIIWRKTNFKVVVIIKGRNRAWDKLFTLKKHFFKSFMLLKYKMIFFFNKKSKRSFSFCHKTAWMIKFLKNKWKINQLLS